MKYEVGKFYTYKGGIKGVKGMRYKCIVAGKSYTTFAMHKGTWRYVCPSRYFSEGPPKKLKTTYWK